MENQGKDLEECVVGKSVILLTSLHLPSQNRSAGRVQPFVPLRISIYHSIYLVKMPRRSVQDNIRIKRERERATSVALAEYSAGGSSSNLPPLPPPVVAPLKRKRGRPTVAERLAEAAAFTASSLAANAALPHSATTSSFNHHVSQASGSQAYYFPAPVPAFHTQNTHPQYSQIVHVPQAAHPAHPAHPALDPSHPFYAVLNGGQPAQPYGLPQQNNPYIAPAADVYAANPSLPLPKAKKPRKTAAEKAAEAGIEHRPAK